MFRYVFLIPRYCQKFFFIYYNRIKMKMAGATIGKNCRIYQGVYVLIKKGAKCVIGDNFSMQSGSNFNPLVRGGKSSIYVSSQSMGGGINW
jgi:acetyltransferase-like isoleucine patch superfamily enzyme